MRGINGEFIPLTCPVCELGTMTFAFLQEGEGGTIKTVMFCMRCKEKITTEELAVQYGADERPSLKVVK